LGVFCQRVPPGPTKELRGATTGTAWSWRWPRPVTEHEARMVSEMVENGGKWWKTVENGGKIIKNPSVNGDQWISMEV